MAPKVRPLGSGSGGFITVVIRAAGTSLPVELTSSMEWTSSSTCRGAECRWGKGLPWPCVAGALSCGHI